MVQKGNALIKQIVFNVSLFVFHAVFFVSLFHIQIDVLRLGDPECDLSRNNGKKMKLEGAGLTPL